MMKKYIACLLVAILLLTMDELFAKDGVTLEANQAYWRCLDGVTTQY